MANGEGRSGFNAGTGARPLVKRSHRGLAWMLAWIGVPAVLFPLLQNGSEEACRRRESLSLAAGPPRAGSFSIPVATSGQFHGLTPRRLAPTKNQYAGGALIAVDATGQSARLSLRKYHIDIHVEDGFARTTIDQTYFNHCHSRLECTFHFPLPPDASISRLAMYVDGNLMEGGIVERREADSIYETIVTQRRDPAVLEWLDGRTFKMRVFPLEARQEKRIILSYSQRVPSLYGHKQYRFAGGHALTVVRDWSFHARIKGGAGWKWTSDTHALNEVRVGQDLLLNGAGLDAAMDRDLVLNLHDPDPAFGKPDAARFSATDQDGYRYLMLRYRPQLPAPAIRPRRDWVFLFESSGERDSYLAYVQIEVIRGILENVGPADTFALLTAGMNVRSFDSKPRPVTPDNMKAAVAFLEETHLIGALDLGKALSETDAFLKAGRDPCLVHLGSGIPTMGERRNDVLARRIPAHVRYVGIGIGTDATDHFMRTMADRHDGVFTQIDPGESISRQAFELVATVSKSRLQNVNVVDESRHIHFLGDGNPISGGEELYAIARLRANGPENEFMPKSVTVSGTVDGRPFQRVIPVDRVAGRAEYLPRSWGQLEIDRLLAENPVKHRPRIVKLSQQMYVLTPFTSLLVLENEAMYQQYGVDRGRKDHWAIYPCPQNILVAMDANDAPGRRANDTAKPSTWSTLHAIRVRVPPPILKGLHENLIDNQHAVTASAIYPRWSANADDDPGPVRNAGMTGVGGVRDTGGERIGGFPRSRGLDGVGNIGGFGGARPGTGAGDSLRLQFRVGFGPDVQEQTAELLNDPGQLRKIRRWRERLDRAITVQFDPLTPLREVLKYLSEQYDLTILIDTEAFKADLMIQEVENLPVRLPKVSGVRLGTVLRLLLDQVQGVYLIRGDYIEITTPQQKELEKKRNPYRLDVFDGLASRGGSFGIDSGLMIFDAADPAAQKYPSAGWKKRAHPQPALEDAFPPFPGFTTIARSTGSPRPWPDNLWNAPGSVGALERIEWTKNPIPFGETLTRKVARPIPYDDLDPFVARILEERRIEINSPPDLRQVFSGVPRIFNDLASYCPGMNTTRADILAVLEAEAEPDARARHGQIDAQARQLIDRAFVADWQTVTISSAGASGTHGADDFLVTMDGRGRFTYDRVLPVGLREQVTCDGETLWHLYPELGIGSRRTFSRFHLTDFASLVPWILPAADELARGADLRISGERTVAIVPHAAGYRDSAASGPGHEVRLVFARNGRLTERRLVDAASGTILRRERYGADGVIQLLDGRGTKLTAQRRVVKPANGPPNLKPSIAGLIVLPLPFRGNYPAGVDRQKDHFPQGIDDDDALAVLAMNFTGDCPKSLSRIVNARFEKRGLHLLGIGLYTLLASAGVDVGPGSDHDVLAAHPDAPLAIYLAQLHNPPPVQGVNLPDGPGARFLQRLLDIRRLHHLRPGKVPAADVATVIKTIRDGPPDHLSWATLCMLRDRVPMESPDRPAITEAFGLFEDAPGLACLARYEQARGLLEQKRRPEARARFVALFDRALHEGRLPPIDRSIRQALQGDDKEADLWVSLMMKASAMLGAENRRLQAVALARQCWLIGDRDLAIRLLSAALERIDEERDHLAATLAAIDFLWQASEFGRADALVESILKDKQFAGRAALWRLRAILAIEQRLSDRFMTSLERAVEIEFQQLPEVIDLEAVGTDCGLLLEHYRQLANASITLNAPHPPDLVNRVVRAADRWRAVDRDNPVVCPLAASILYKLKAHDLAWEYLNTPLALYPPDAESWLELAKMLGRQQDFDLAERAYEQAAEAEPDNVPILWDRARNLDRAGRLAEAQKIYDLLTEGQWPSALQWINEEARRQSNTSTNSPQ